MTQTVVTVTEPQTYLDTSVANTPSNGRIVLVSGSDNLQTIFDAALPGDVITLSPGTTYTGNFTLSASGNAGAWITVMAAGTLPAEGTRMTAATAVSTGLPKIQTPNTVQVLSAMPSASPASYWRFIGIEFTDDGSQTESQGLIRIGENSSSQTSTSHCPHDFIFDRCYVHASTNLGCRKAFSFDGARLACIDSTIAGIHSTFDAQCITGTNGPGPFKITNNYLQASGENIAWGGADPWMANLVPSDIEVRHNHFTKDLSWLGTWLLKNLYESKNSRRVLVEGNVFENSPVDGQAGYAVVLWSVNQDGGGTWCVTEHQTFRKNTYTKCKSGFQLSQKYYATTAVAMNHVAISNEVFIGMNDVSTGVGGSRMFTINDEIDNLSIEHCTGFDNDSTFVWTGTSKLANHVIQNNVLGGGDYQMFTPYGQGSAAWALIAGDSSLFLGNVMALFNPALGEMAGNYYPQTFDAVGLVGGASVAFSPTATVADLALSGSSDYKNLATDGTDPGADMVAVAAAIAGVTTGSAGSDTGTVTPTPSVLTTLALAPSTLTVVAGNAGAVNATAFDQFSAAMTLPTLTGHTSDATKATVSVSGSVVTITGVAAGSATITVSSGTVTSNSVAVTVTAAPSDPIPPPTDPGPITQHGHKPKITGRGHNARIAGA